jgi:hypothetical protein
MEFSIIKPENARFAHWPQLKEAMSAARRFFKRYNEKWTASGYGDGGIDAAMKAFQSTEADDETLRFSEDAQPGIGACPHNGFSHRYVSDAFDLFVHKFQQTSLFSGSFLTDTAAE